MKKFLLKDFLRELSPIFVGFILIWFIQQEIAITIVLILLLLLTFKLKYYKNENKFFIFGVVLGFLLETVSDYFYKLQYWEQGSLLGIPLWLPILWGYGFIIIRRVGNLIVKE